MLKNKQDHMNMVGSWGLEPQTFTVSKDRGDCQSTRKFI
jgi:hypothetical protein